MKIETKSLAKAIALATSMSASMIGAASADITLRGASMFDEEHAYTKTLREFEPAADRGL